MKEKYVNYLIIIPFIIAIIITLSFALKYPIISDVNFTLLLVLGSILMFMGFLINANDLGSKQWKKIINMPEDKNTLIEHKLDIVGLDITEIYDSIYDYIFKNIHMHIISVIKNKHIKICYRNRDGPVYGEVSSPSLEELYEYAWRIVIIFIKPLEGVLVVRTNSISGLNENQDIAYKVWNITSLKIIEIINQP